MKTRRAKLWLPTTALILLALSAGMLLTLSTCKKREEPTAEPTVEPEAEAPAPVEPVAEKPAPVKAGPAPPSVLEVPPDVILHGGLASFGGFSKAAGEVTSPFLPLPVGLFLTQALKENLGLQTMTWLDRDRPVNFFVMNPKSLSQPAVLMFPMTSQEAARNALPKTAEEGDDKNDMVFSASFRNYYANFLEGYMVITLGAGVYAKARPFAESLTEVERTSPIELTSAMTNVRRIFADEIGALEEEAKRLATEPSPFSLPSLDDTIERQYDILFKTLHELESIQLALTTPEERLRLDLWLTSQKTGMFVDRLASMIGHKSELVDLLPTASYLIMAYAADPKGLEDVAKIGIDFLVSILEFDEEEAEEVASLYSRLLLRQTGDQAFGISRASEFAVGLEYICATEAGAKETREIALAFYDRIWDKVAALVKKSIEEDGEKLPEELDLTDLGSVIASANLILAPQGVSMRLKQEEYKGATIDYLDITLDYDKAPELTEERRKLLGALVGGRIQLAMGFAPNWVHQVVGPNAVERIKEALDGEKPLLANPTLRTAREGMKAGGGLLYFDPIAALKAVGDIPPLADKRSAIEELDSAGGIAVELHAVEANQLQFALDISLRPIAKIVKLFN